MRDDRAAHLLEGRRLGMIHAHAGVRFCGRHRDVECRRRTEPAVTMPERGCGVGAVGSLVAREAQVAVDTHHRTARRTRIGLEVARDLVQSGREVADEVEHRLAHLALIAIAVALEPFAIVVAAELLEELEERGLEVALRRHRRWPSRAASAAAKRAPRPRAGMLALAHHRRAVDD